MRAGVQGVVVVFRLVGVVPLPSKTKALLTVALSAPHHFALGGKTNIGPIGGLEGSPKWPIGSAVVVSSHGVRQKFG